MAGHFKSYSPALNRYTPMMAQVIDSMPLAWEEQIIHRRDRKRTLAVMADAYPMHEETPAQMFARVRADIRSHCVTTGGAMKCSGEVSTKSSSKAQKKRAICVLTGSAI